MEKTFLKETLREAGATQRELADFLGLDYTIVNKMITGSRGIEIAEFAKIVEFFRVRGFNDIINKFGIDTSQPVRRVAVVGMASVAAFIKGNETGLSASRECDDIFVPGDTDTLIATTVPDSSMNLEFGDAATIVINYSDRELVDRKFYLVRAGGEPAARQYRASPPRFEPRSTDPTFETVFANPDTETLGRIVQIVKIY